MINVYHLTNGTLHRHVDSADIDGAVWIDLLNPNPADEATIEAALHLDIPTREEVRTIEESSQIYRDGEALVMTARIISKSETPSLRLVHVTFILLRKKLITLRYGDPSPFRNFLGRAEKEALDTTSGVAVMVGLLEAIVDRAAEILQSVGDELETLSTDIFTHDGPSSGARRQADLQPVLQQIGRNGDLATRVRESLHSVARIVPTLQAEGGQPGDGQTARLRIVGRDIASLLSHGSYLMSNVTFLLDATLGLINIQQNAIIKIFSVAAVIFLPPTLIASIFGMNFTHMPELGWRLGYPYALGLMVISAILPYAYFKRRSWL